MMLLQDQQDIQQNQEEEEWDLKIHRSVIRSEIRETSSSLVLLSFMFLSLMISVFLFCSKFRIQLPTRNYNLINNQESEREEKNEHKKQLQAECTYPT